ncbi:MAG TPA: hypothetical protein PKC30_15805 [Saprospiraceae bacterium]|nr:hypothetical protein [Saprospiraceae bacterium]
MIVERTVKNSSLYSRMMLSIQGGSGLGSAVFGFLESLHIVNDEDIHFTVYALTKFY